MALSQLGFQRGAAHIHRKQLAAQVSGPRRLPVIVHNSAGQQAEARAAGGDSSTINGRSFSKASAGSLDLSEWGPRGVPSYLQSTQNIDLCSEESQAITMGMAGQLLWQAIRKEAQADAQSEPLLSSFLYASILAHDSFERSLAFVLSNRLSNSTMLPTQLFEIFHSVLHSDADVRCAALSDIAACRERDPACQSFSSALLYYKGYHALQTYRIAHHLWCKGQRVMALALQSRISEVFAVDIHPAAQIGKGVLLDHGTGVVIGETAVVGNNVSLLQNVTLGGTGKEVGDRHPKVADNVLIGACATILGNIRIGAGAQIAAGSLVLKPVPPRTMVAGSPAKEVGPVLGNPALNMVHWSKRLLLDPLNAFSNSPTASADTVAAIEAELPAAGPWGPPPGAYAAAGSNGNGRGAAAARPSPPASPMASLDDEDAAANGLPLPSKAVRGAGEDCVPCAEAAAKAKAMEQQKDKERERGSKMAAIKAGLHSSIGPSLPGQRSGVESTTDPKEAARRWGSKAVDPEYLI